MGPIVSGEKVLGDAASHESKQIKQNYSDALAAEMEGYGFFDAVWRNGGIDALVIRGIFDYCDKDKSVADAGGSQEIAAACASAVAFEFLANYSQFHLKNKQREYQHTIRQKKSQYCPMFKNNFQNKNNLILLKSQINRRFRCL